MRGGMEVAVANAPGYEGYDRTSFDAILSEHIREKEEWLTEIQLPIEESKHNGF